MRDSYEENWNFLLNSGFVQTSHDESDCTKHAHKLTTLDVYDKATFFNINLVKIVCSLALGMCRLNSTRCHKNKTK